MSNRLPRVTFLLQAVVLTVCLVVGAYAALVGGAAARHGQGRGGLGGVPQLALLATAGLLGGLSAVTSRSLGRAAVVLGGPLVVALGYFFAAHAVDPCTTGVVGLGTRVDGARLCTWTAGGPQLADRFHLLEHVVVAAALLLAYAALLRAVLAERPAGGTARLAVAPRRLSSVGRAPHS